MPGEGCGVILFGSFSCVIRGVGKVPYVVKLPVYEGPFELLYDLVRKQEIDIWSVSVTDITAQYLDYLRLMEEFNLEIAGEFLVMAATLLRLKSRMLLPAGSEVAVEEETGEGLFSIHSSEELIRRIMEYRAFKLAANFLQKREAEQQKIFFRSTGEPKIMHVTRQETFFFREGMLEKLVSAMKRIMQSKSTREKEPHIEPVEEYNVHERKNLIIRWLSQRQKAVYLDSMLETRSPAEIISTFIAVLDLTLQKKVIIWQQYNLGPILLEITSSAFEGWQKESGAEKEERETYE